MILINMNYKIKMIDDIDSANKKERMKIKNGRIKKTMLSLS